MTACAQFFKAGEFAKAIASWNKGLKEEPNNVALLSNRAAAFLSLGKEVRALKDAEQCVEIDPTWVKGHYRKGLALEKLKRYDEAIKAFLVALELEPKNGNVIASIKDLIEKRAAGGTPGRE